MLNGAVVERSPPFRLYSGYTDRPYRLVPVSVCSARGVPFGISKRRGVIPRSNAVAPIRPVGILFVRPPDEDYRFCNSSDDRRALLREASAAEAGMGGRNSSLDRIWWRDVLLSKWIAMAASCEGC
jgi:hypothetical protein